MYELIPLHENTYYMECPAKVGLYFSADQKAIIIDSGIDKDTAKKIERHLLEREVSLSMILNTHSHADHCGGDFYLQEKTGCPIYAPDLESAIIRQTFLEPSILYGGYPYKELRNKFLMAKPAMAMDIQTASLPKGFEWIELPGHTFQQIGIRTPDDIWFIADSLFDNSILTKYSYTFMYDIQGQMETLEKLKTLKGLWFVPSHGNPTQNLSFLIQQNQEKLRRDLEQVKGFCGEGITWEELLKKVMDYQQQTLNHNQYVLIGFTLRSYLSYLKDQQELICYFEENRLLWALP